MQCHTMMPPQGPRRIEPAQRDSASPLPGRAQHNRPTSRRRIRKAPYTLTSSVNKSQIIHTAADAAKSARIAHQNIHLDPSRVMRETTEEKRTKKLTTVGKQPKQHQHSPRPQSVPINQHLQAATPRLRLHRRHTHTHTPIPGIMPAKSHHKDGPYAFALSA